MRFFWLQMAAIPLMAASYNVTELMEHALQNDAALKADREMIQQYFYQKESVRIWDNPELSLSYSRTKPEGIDTKNEYGIALIQPVEKPSLKTAKQKVLDAKILQSKALALYKENEIKGDVRQKAYLYAVADLMAQKAEESLSLAATLRQKGEKRFEQGAVSKADLLKLQVEEAKIAQEAQAAKIKRNAAQYALATSARLTFAADLTPIKLPNPSPVDVVPNLENLPMIGYFKAAEEEYRAQKEVVSKSVIPGFKAGLGVQQLYDQQAVTASLSMPIPILHRNESLIKNAESRLSENRLREQSYRFETEQKLLRQQKLLKGLSTLILSQERLIDQSSHMVSMSQRSYEEGYGTLLELIDARRVLIAHQHERLNNLEMYYDTLGEMQKTFPPTEEKQ
ncbi:MAG: TolC family protein [Sulfuricurvum sp.]|jgi:outer membrane protein TolC|uniref:TolC family protein n=1 Tax=Sulfuricurvum sp. TaxID=2025608 RepID=UPI0025EC043D|nr:TolC family protein [Sulfuricurvum sp.]MCK9374433.1 TolC family protein [Sulfuricurvum sp.]